MSVKNLDDLEYLDHSVRLDLVFCDTFCFCKHTEFFNLYTLRLRKLLEIEKRLEMETIVAVGASLVTIYF